MLQEHPISSLSLSVCTFCLQEHPTTSSARRSSSVSCRRDARQRLITHLEAKRNTWVNVYVQRVLWNGNVVSISGGIDYAVLMGGGTLTFVCVHVCMYVCMYVCYWCVCVCVCVSFACVCVCVCRLCVSFVCGPESSGLDRLAGG